MRLLCQATLRTNPVRETSAMVELLLAPPLAPFTLSLALLAVTFPRD
ncbi:hypothetical protein M2324_004017 [Rhodovulum sulfidophilum]|nr:hypothetical protein [Rhodovulum sulfidophilum]MCW2305590.1 hypothetical protein [Rhodovulum sulfidophilum]